MAEAKRTGASARVAPKASFGDVMKRSARRWAASGGAKLTIGIARERQPRRRLQARPAPKTTLGDVMMRSARRWARTGGALVTMDAGARPAPSTAFGDVMKRCALRWAATGGAKMTIGIARERQRRQQQLPTALAAAMGRDGSSLTAVHIQTTRARRTTLVLALASTPCAATGKTWVARWSRAAGQPRRRLLTTRMRNTRNTDDVPESGRLDA